MFTIKWVADQLGLTPGTLRAWEQRYGIVQPQRSESGYRLYGETDFALLQTMARLVRAGMQPAQAAEQARSGHQSAPTSIPPPQPGPSRTPPGGMPDPQALLVASRTYDDEALEAALDAAFTAARFEQVIDVWLMAAMAEVGAAWVAGELNIAQEHFISAGVMRRLAAAFEAAGHAKAGRHILIGLAPGATHEIATLAFATMLRRAGLRVTYLGPDLPVSSWVEAVDTIRPDAVVLGAPQAGDGPAAAEVVRALAGSRRTPVYVGGAGATPEHALAASSLGEASDWLATTLARA